MKFNSAALSQYYRFNSITISIHEILLGLIILFFVLYSLFGINLPWGYEHNGFIGAERSTYSMNYLKFGYKGSKLGLLTNIGSLETGKEQYEYNIHHPIGIHLLISFSFLVFGIHEWSARLVPILINVGTILIVYLFVKEYWKARAALFSAFFMVFNPMFFYSRNFLAVEHFAVFFWVVLLYIYVKWLKTEKSKYFYLIFITFALGTLSDWQFYFAVPTIILHYFGFVNKKKKNKKIVLLIPFSIFLFLIYLGHVWLLTGSMGGGNFGITGDLFGNFLFRLNISESSKQYNITLFGLLGKLYNNSLHFYTKVLTFTPILFFLLLLSKIFTKKAYEKDGLPLLMFLSLLSYSLIFNNLFWIHPFYITVFNPTMAVLGALLVENSWSYVEEKRRTIRIIFYVLFIAILIIFSYDFYNHSKQEYHNSNKVEPIIEFLSQNNNDIIVSFDEHPQAFTFRYYLSKVNVKDIRNRGELINFLNKKNSYRYFLVKDKKSLKDFLTPRYHHIEIGDYTIFDLTIPISKNQFLGAKQYPETSPTDISPPKLAIFSPLDNIKYNTTEIEINTVSDESCSFSYSWDEEGNITGPKGGYNLKVSRGEFTNYNDRNIVLELHMNENIDNKIYDDSGKGNHGTLINGDWVLGKFGRATGYDGITSFVNIKDTQSIRISEKGLTIATWIWIEDDNKWKPILRKGTNGMLNYNIFITPNNKLVLSMDNVTGSPIESSSNIPPNNWVHVAGTYDGNFLSLYVNGELDVRKDAKGDLINSSMKDLTLGRDIDQNVWFSGNIDELIIWNRHLSPKEIKKVYNPTLTAGDHYVDVYCKDLNDNSEHSRRHFTIKPIPK
jgi:hypothetical protein